MKKVQQIAKMIDHSLLHPTMTDEDLRYGCEVAKKYNVASVCIKPYAVTLAKELLDGTDVDVCTVIGFPQGNSAIEAKVFEAATAAKDGAYEIDMVVNIGKVLGGDWGYVKDEISQINEACVSRGSIMKVIFENDFLEEKHIQKLCEICNEVDVAFVKTSTGYGFVKDTGDKFVAVGATMSDLALMRKVSNDHIEIKAAGGVRTLEAALEMQKIGISRIGTSGTEAILADAEKMFGDAEA